MLPSPDDSRLTPDQRRREIASILARGILRLHSMARTAQNSAGSGAAEHAPEPTQKALEVSAQLRPHVTRGY
jgi:hypothetical protein